MKEKLLFFFLFWFFTYQRHSKRRAACMCYTWYTSWYIPISQEFDKKEKLRTNSSYRKIFKACEMHNSVQGTENGRKIFVRAAVYKNMCNFNTLIGVSKLYNVWHQVFTQTQKASVDLDRFRHSFPVNQNECPEHRFGFEWFNCK